MRIYSNEDSLSFFLKIRDSPREKQEHIANSFSLVLLWDYRPMVSVHSNRPSQFYEVFISGIHFAQCVNTKIGGLTLPSQTMH